MRPGRATSPARCAGPGRARTWCPPGPPPATPAPAARRRPTTRLSGEGQTRASPLGSPTSPGDCGPPPRFAFAEPPLPLNDSYPSGTSLRYRCRTGYTVASGKSPYVTCLPNSTWSAESDFCIVLPALHHNGMK
uniref:Sushi domain-containing protein n=1 Tax=Dromaius novaehollandiae TaxID=8790 RepID=A0A8C4PAB5_DRONO